MHSLNVRCLTTEYSSMEFCPKEIVAVVVDIEEFCMSDVGLFVKLLSSMFS